MQLIRGTANGATLTGTLYERGDRVPTFSGAPNEESPYVFVCDEFYEVESGGLSQRVGDREVHVAFETPMPRGFDTRKQALAVAREHVVTQFSRIGVDPDDVEIEVLPEYEA